MPYSKYSPKQKGLAALSGNKKKIDSGDLKVLRSLKTNGKKRKPKNRKA
tara:strand:- start:13 stop:159 length:147 start_codon:yes stop_codon:yes gene_type:complete